MRLTEKFTNACGGCYEPITNDREVCDKLGQLEDIEEEFGIDLIMLNKVWNNGIYARVSLTEIVCIEPEDIHLTKKKSFAVRYWVDDWSDYCNFGIDILQYGKTWAFTKDELEK